MELVDIRIWKEKWEYNSGKGRRDILSSFMVAIKDFQDCDSVFVPAFFHEAHGSNLCSELLVKCKQYVWCVKYNMEKKAIYGLQIFMLYYGLRTCSFIQFDYYGESMFILSIFTEYAIECKYPEFAPAELFGSEKCLEDDKRRYMESDSKIAHENRCMLLSFNAKMNIPRYYELVMEDAYICGNITNLRFNAKLDELYQNCKVPHIFLRIGDSTWEVFIECNSNCSTLGKGWSDFVQGAELVLGDILVLYHQPSSNNNVFNVCVFNGMQSINRNVQGTGKCKLSFFKMITNEIIGGNSLVVPKLVEDSFFDVLASLEKILVDGDKFFVTYDSDEHSLRGMNELFEYYKVCNNEFIVFSLEAKSILKARIYQVDGMEVDYYNRTLKYPKYSSVNCFWEFVNVAELEEKGIKSAHHGNQIEIPVQKSKIPRFVFLIDSNVYEEPVLTIPDEVFGLLRDEVPYNASITLPAGRTVDVLFRKDMQCISHISFLLKECQKNLGCILVVSYEGRGNFSVNVFDGDGSEVDYHQRQRRGSDCISEVPMIVEPIGWRFISIVTELSIVSGQFEIPSSFLRRFRNSIPQTFLCSLRNEKFIEGHYSMTEDFLLVDVELVEYAKIEEDDTVMFNYLCCGKFEIVIFDKQRLEKTERKYPKCFESEETDEGKSMEVYAIQKVGDSDMAEFQVEVEDKEILNMRFKHILTRSNVDNSTHGVYIPPHINPSNRKWKAYEKILLRTGNGEWTVGITISGGRPRLSAGWNKFTTDNNLMCNETLVFNFLPDDESGIVFNVYRE